MNFTTRFLQTIAVMGCAAYVCPVWAEESPDDDVLSVYERQRPEYSAKGIPAGGFIVQPSVTMGGHYSDNIRAESRNTTSDTIATVAPSVAVRSRWYNHGVEISVGSTMGYYTDNTDENYQDYHARVGGHYDLQRGVKVHGNAAFQHKHENRSSPDDRGGVEPNSYEDTTVALGFNRDVGKVGLAGNAEVKELDYDDNRRQNGTVIDNDARDRTEQDYVVELSYKFIPHYRSFVRLGYEVVTYDQAAAVSRDSTGYSASVGTAVNLTGKVKGEVYGGYLQRGYDSAGFGDINTYNLGGDMLWNITPITSLRFGLSRAIEETTDATSAGYTSTGVSAGAEHELRRNVLLFANLDYQNHAYEGGGIALQREDEVYNNALGFHYLLPHPGVSLGGAYYYSERESNTVNNNFTENRVSMNLNWAF